jgi:hypothetical protein
MGELSDQPASPDYSEFVEGWYVQVVAVFLRAVRQPVLAFDLATETLAVARLRWGLAPSDDEARVAWVLGLGTNVLDAAVNRQRVPATERRRAGQPTPRELSVAEQQEILALAEEHLELPLAARDAADALARMAPPPHVLATLRPSGLVRAEPLPDRTEQRNGA